MKILVHDFAGHPFQIDLSRELARRGYQVVHLYCSSIVGAKGNLQNDSNLPNLVVKPVGLGRNINRYDFLKRLFDERKYGALLSAEIDEHLPDVVISSNTPLDAQKQLQNKCKGLGVKFVYWLQDMIGVATYEILSKKSAIFLPVGWYYKWLEKTLLKNSDSVVAISEDFHQVLNEYRVDKSNIHIVENWAPLDELDIAPRDNNWLQEIDVPENAKVAIYSGALGLKHNPQLLLDLARSFERSPDDMQYLIVVSEGYGADWLKDQLEQQPCERIRVVNFQPFERVPSVLGSADVVLAILEPEASQFCVPSKVLTYMCLGRPTILAADKNNLASRILHREDAGAVVSPDNSEQLIKEVANYFGDLNKCELASKNARAYAVESFDIKAVADRFDSVIKSIG